MKPRNSHKPNRYGQGKQGYLKVKEKGTKWKSIMWDAECLSLHSVPWEIRMLHSLCFSWLFLQLCVEHLKREHNFCMLVLSAQDLSWEWDSLWKNNHKTPTVQQSLYTVGWTENSMSALILNVSDSVSCIILSWLFI